MVYVRKIFFLIKEKHLKIIENVVTAMYYFFFNRRELIDIMYLKIIENVVCAIIFFFNKGTNQHNMLESWGIIIIAHLLLGQIGLYK